MEKRKLGRTGLWVTPLGVGCAALGDMPETFTYSVALEQALDTVRAIFQSPINFLDTAAPVRGRRKRTANRVGAARAGRAA